MSCEVSTLTPVQGSVFAVKINIARNAQVELNELC